MLTSLSIQNFALIEKLSIGFSGGFSTITGETGAGKSILLGALGLVLGKRADVNSLKHKEEKCVIEASFDISKYNLKDFFGSKDLDFDNQTIIRREILPNGKTRAFVNDSPININDLQELGLFLIDIHSQNQTQQLGDEATQFAIIDAIAGINEQVLDFENELRVYKKNKTNLSNLVNQQKDLTKEQDYNNYLLQELVDAKLSTIDQQELETQQKELSNVEFVKENLSKAIAIAEDEQIGTINQLKEIKIALQKNAQISENYFSIGERFNSLLIDFDDIFSELNNISEKVINDPEQLEVVNQKLQLIYNLQKKHQVQTIEELLEIQKNLETKLLNTEDIAFEIKKLEKLNEELELKLNGKASFLTEKRQVAIPILTDKLVQILELLGMPNARFNIELKEAEQYMNNGKNELNFLFSANKGTDFGILKKVASGGEMSRIMLATKAILSGYSNLPTIIFDEIDTGVSGEIANKMAAIMKKMSLKMQVFSITHLPQIASKGNEQFKVFKTTINEQTKSEIKKLNQEERIKEIAEMLSGADISESAMIHAKALLN